MRSWTAILSSPLCGLVTGATYIADTRAWFTCRTTEPRVLPKHAAGALLSTVLRTGSSVPILISRHFRRLSITALIALVNACSGGGDRIIGPSPVTPEDTAAPPFQRDMRGLWVATVANIDWPSARTLTADQKKAELSDIIARAAAAGINTIVLQVRPAGDAVYQSPLEPWASLLSGTQGTNPGYDPLAFAIQE